MRINIDAMGKMTISPDNSLEAFALSCWANKALVNQYDVQRDEETFFRGSMLIIETAITP